MNEMQLFHFEGHEVHVLDRDGKPWWIGDEAGKLLGYVNVPDAISKHVRDKHKGIAICDTLRGPQEKIVISEAGLYSLIMRSKKPEAERFQDWVFEEVLPTIRKTGSYGKPAVDHHMIADINKRFCSLEDKFNQFCALALTAKPIGRVVSIHGFINEVWPGAPERYHNRIWSEICFELRRSGRGPVTTGESRGSEFQMLEDDLSLALPIVLRNACYFVEDHVQPLLTDLDQQPGERRSRNRKPKQNG